MEKDKEKMSYDLIYQVYQKERQSAALTKLERDFYDRVAGLIKGLSDEYDAESKTNPSSTKCMILYDELKKIRTLFHEIYEYRIRKIVLMALTGASEGTVDTKSLVDLEASVFDQLKAILKKSYDEVGLVETGCPVPGGVPSRAMGTEAKPAPAVAARQTTDVGPKAALADGKVAEVVNVQSCPTEAARPATEAPVKKKKVVTVQILEDIPKFAAEGGEVYTLKKKDYASLPQPMAERLEKQGKARIMPT